MSMRVTLLVEGRKDGWTAHSAGVLATGKYCLERGDEVAVVVVGQGAEQFAKQGWSAVYEVGEVEYPDAPRLAEALAQLPSPELGLVPGSALGELVGALWSEKLGAGFANFVEKVEFGEGLAFWKPNFGGGRRVRVEVRRTPVVLAMGRTEEEFVPGAGEVAVQKLSLPEREGWDIVEQAEEEVLEVRLEEAPVVVAGGRGVGSAEGFEKLRELARLLGGEIGATRAVTDAGWLPPEYQVGQSGKIVKPRVYLALGISGAIQHRVGMEGSEFVIAVNTDPRADIFKVSDLGYVGDLHEIVPRLIARIRERGLKPAM